MTYFKTIFTVLINSLLFVIYAFALPHHLKTFFSPFKRMTEKTLSPGLNLSELAEVVSYNLISVVIGLLLRSFIILSGLVVLSLALVISLILLILLTYLFPFLWPAIKFIKSHRQHGVVNLYHQALLQPGPTLCHLLTQKPLGKFIRQKLVISESDLANLVSPPDKFSPPAQPASLADLLISLAKNYPPFHNYLTSKLLDESDITQICSWYQNLLSKDLLNFLDRNAVTKISGLGADWSYGYTNNLDKFRLTHSFGSFPRVIGRDSEIIRVEEILSKTTQNSVILAGEPGVGRHAVVDEFSRRLFAGKVTKNLVGFQTLYLDLKSALAAGQNPLELFTEGEQASNIILVIDNFENHLDLIDVFNETLAGGKLRVIGITTQDIVDKSVAQNTSLLKLFSVVSIKPPSLDTVYLEMELSISPVLEKDHQVEISYPAIKEAVNDADQYISILPFPEKAISLLDETISFVKTSRPETKIILGTDVQAYLATKNQVPVGNLSTSAKDKLAHLEDKLHERIISQDEAVSAVAKAMRRAVLSVSARTKPIGTFLFLGPTGVGKTETAKALAEIYFGSESRLTRFDMSEYQGEIGLERLLDQMPKALINNPFAVVLLDEIEKTPPLILNLFLTLLDEGYLADSQGRKISARQNIIIGTSNAAALYIKNRINDPENLPTLSADIIKYVQDEKIFSPEFINRFDAVIVFKPLTDTQMRLVIKKLLAGVAARLIQKKITFQYSDSLIDQIISKGYDPSSGARSVRRYIQDTVEDTVSQKLLSGNYPPGSTLKI